MSDAFKNWLKDNQDVRLQTYTIGVEMFDRIVQAVRNEALREAASLCRTSAHQWHAEKRIKAMIVP